IKTDTTTRSGNASNGDIELDIDGDLDIGNRTENGYQHPDSNRYNGGNLYDHQQQRQQHDHNNKYNQGNGNGGRNHSVAFDLGTTDDDSSRGGPRSERNKRIMKKKTSVIKMSGNVQGRREDDGFIR